MDPRWKASSEDNPVLLKMEHDCQVALASVKAALKLMKSSPAARGRPGSVGPEAVKDLTMATKVLANLVGPESPFVWGVIDPDQV